MCFFAEKKNVVEFCTRKIIHIGDGSFSVFSVQIKSSTSPSHIFRTFFVESAQFRFNYPPTAHASSSIFEDERHYVGVIKILSQFFLGDKQKPVENNSEIWCFFAR